MRPSTTLESRSARPSRARARALGAALVLLGGAALVTACTSILGDFKVGATTAGDGGPNDGNVGSDAPVGDDGGSDAPGNSKTLDDVLQVAAGEKHTCALRKDHTVYCWGDNSRGQLGTSSVIGSSKLPVKVANVSNAFAITSGSQHSCAIAGDPANPGIGGRVLCWGDNTLRQLGKAAPADFSADVVPATKPGGGGDYTNAVAIAAGLNTNCSADANSGFFCWGDNSAGQFGNGTTTPLKSEIPSASSPSISLQGAEFGAGGTQACAVGTMGGVTAVSALCWGGNQHGEVGNGQAPGAGPFQPSGVAPGTTDAGVAPYKHVAAGHTHSCAIDGNSDVFCWGSNDFGEAGPSTTVGAPHTSPGACPGAHGAVAISAGEQSTCVLTNGDFKVKCWGKNAFGELGNGNTDSTGVAPQAQPQEVNGLTGVGRISVGARHACAVVKALPQPGQIDNAAGQVYCWGSGDSGRLGNGADSTSNLPVKVSKPQNEL